jgi:hypothetical protein
MQFAPRMRTILVALALILLGIVGTFGNALSEPWGSLAFVAAAALLLLGIFFEGI